jgi:hypothetical protein
MTLPGLMSRWTMPSWWTAARASLILATNSAACGGSITRPLAHSDNGTPSIHSIVT